MACLTRMHSHRHVQEHRWSCRILLFIQLHEQPNPSRPLVKCELCWDAHPCCVMTMTSCTQVLLQQCNSELSTDWCIHMCLTLSVSVVKQCWVQMSTSDCSACTVAWPTFHIRMIQQMSISRRKQLPDVHAVRKRMLNCFPGACTAAWKG